MPKCLHNHTISYTEPYELDDFTRQFPTQPYATTIEEVTEAAYNVDHPCVVSTEPLYIFIQCAHCGKIAAKNRRELRRNIKHRHITTVFCNKTCSWNYYNAPGSPHDAYTELKQANSTVMITRTEARREHGRQLYQRYLASKHAASRENKDT